MIQKNDQTLVWNDNSTINYGSFQNYQNAFLLYTVLSPLQNTIVGINSNKF